MTQSPLTPRAEALQDEGSVATLLTANENGDPGSELWDFIVTFVAARRTFLSIYRRYEKRVLSACKRLNVRREDLVLPPQELFELFNLRRMTYLKDARLKPLRDLAERIFERSGDEELLDVYCSHIYHELSILSEEHRSVGRFIRTKDRRRYRLLFEEVSGYYPERLRRIRRLFTGGLRRIELLLPRWAEHRIIVRCVYLFGDRLALHASGQDVRAIYRRMYPEGGEVKGYYEAAVNFRSSSFLARARDAAQKAVDAAGELRRRRPLERAEERSGDAAAALVAALDAEAGVKNAP
jgi:hypothetical protein